MADGTRASPPAWMSRAVLGIVAATFFSDVGHEMATAVLPLHLTAIGLGVASLGFIEGLADFLFSLAKLGGGWLGQRIERKRPLATLGYLVTALGTAALGLAGTLVGLATARSAAWLGRGLRSPLRDFMLADAVAASHLGRAFGVERAADMLGAVAGPLVAAALLASGSSARSILLLSLGPSLVAAGAFYALTRERPAAAPGARAGAEPRAPLPRRYWLFVTGVGLFGLGDFSRTILVMLAASALGAGAASPGTLSVAVLLYALHNLISATAAYPAGRLGDRSSKLHVLLLGYGLGVATNLLLAAGSASLPLLVVAIALSGVYLAVEETLEKAVAAELLPREQRSLGLGVLAAANAAGDMLSSVLVGLLIAAGHTRLAFLGAAGFGLLGIAWLARWRRALGPSR